MQHTPRLPGEVHATDADGDLIHAYPADQNGGPEGHVEVRIASAFFAPLAVYLTPEQARTIADGLTVLAEEVSK